MTKHMVILDGNEAAASVAYRLSEMIAIYPITPASPMGEWADEWSHQSKTNIWGTVPRVVEMQSEAGAAGALHGAIQTGALGTTFTASQGLLLMIPNMYKIAGELTPIVIHVAARSLATHALSIFGDHSDVMAARSTGFALLCSCTVQEAQDLTFIAHAGSLESRIPFLHFFDGFRTSHEVAKILPLSNDDLRALTDDTFIRQHRKRALTPDQPVLRGTAQNPDVFFQAREAVNPFYHACPTIVQQVMDRFAERTRRSYHLFDYVGDPEAERVIVLMGSAAGAVEETIDALRARGERVGLLKVRLFRPFDVNAFLSALPCTTHAIAVLDRTKEPGAAGEPLYMDVLTALGETFTRFHGNDSPQKFPALPNVIGGRYGLSSKEFTPAMAKAVFDELGRERPRNHFTIGIYDDVTFASLAFLESFSTENPRTTRAIFYGLGSDGTVGANKNSIKIIGNPLLASPERILALDARVLLVDPKIRNQDLPRPAIRPYPLQYASRWTMKNGTHVNLRPIRPEDEPAMAKFHELLSDETVYLRYFHMAKLDTRIAHERLVRKCFIDYDREMALVAELASANSAVPMIVGVGRLSRRPLSDEAELAVVVADSCQHQGLGGELIARLVTIARTEGLKRIVAEFHSENSAIRHMAAHGGAKVERTSDPMCFRVAVSL